MIKDYSIENTELIKRAADGDETARNQLIISNMRLVHSVVKRFLGRGHDGEDLFQIGCIGLIRAAQRFDSGFGVQFSTYAVPMIIGEIKRFIRDDGIIRVSRSLKETAARAAQIAEKLMLKTGREATVSEIASEMNISATELAAAYDSRLKPQSIYAQADDCEHMLIDKIEDPSDEMKLLADKLSVRQALDDCSERDRLIIFLRYYRGKTQAQVANQLGISQVQVSRLEKKILMKMREKIADE